VNAYSRTYYTLLAHLPQLKETFAIGEKDKGAGQPVTIEIVESADELSDAEINTIVRGW
jgi:hypothetical protein